MDRRQRAVIVFVWLLACRPAATPRLAVDPPASAPIAGADSLYLVMVDRFADGRPGPEPTDRSDPQAWHGGDLVGVAAHLDHLQSLGIGAVWLTPLTDSQEHGVDRWGAFHGYWVHDAAAAEPRLGTIAEARALSDALHARGMALYLDVVTNHVGYDAPLREAQPDWFHGNGDIVDWADPVQAVTHDVHGLPDLAQERPAVYAHLRDTTAAWVQAVQPDGLRLDAVRHLPEGFLARLGADLRQRSDRPLMMLGEVFEGDVAALAARQRTDALDEVFDFPLHYALVDTFCDDAPVGRLASVLSLDGLYDDPDRLVTFLDNHDLPRIQSACHDDDARVEAALAFLLTARGRPSLTWGTEVALTGAEEPHNRKSLPWDGLDAHPRRQLIADLLNLRRLGPELRGGSSRVLVSTAEHLVVLRSTAAAASLIVVNRSADSLPVSGILPPGAAAASAWEVRGGVLLFDATTVGPGGVGGVGLDLGPARLAELREPPMVRMRVGATVPLGPGESLRLVGSDPALGSWSVEHALAPDADGAFTLSLPDGAVVACKLVVIGPHAPRWEPRADRYLTVHAGRLDLRWAPSE